MKITKVENSSNISAIGYDEVKISLSSNIVNILRIYFKNGLIYDYYNVPNEVYEEFLKSESKGTFFHKNINKKYTFLKVEK